MKYSLKELDMSNIVLYVQPAYNYINDKIEYAEVLIREYKGIEGSESIIKFVTKNKLEEQFDLDVFREACKYISGKKLKYPIGINLCPATLKSYIIISEIEDALDEFNIDSSDVIIEINEGTHFENKVVSANLKKLHELGFKLALDDFGVQHANMYSLINFKFDILKVDKCFVGHEAEESKNEILTVITALCKAFHLTPIIEGVETKNQMANISNFGYEIIQGFFYMKPTPLDEYSWE